MKKSLIKHWSAVALAAACGVVTAFAAPYEKGQKLESFKAEDQFGTEYTFDPAATRFLLVSHDMDTGKKANAALTALGKEYLPGKGAVYFANIHGMPGIGRMFAIPKMKKYSHRIILGDDEALIARFPEQAGKVTVLKVSSGKVQSVTFWTPGTEAVDDYLK